MVWYRSPLVFGAALMTGVLLSALLLPVFSSPSTAFDRLGQDARSVIDVLVLDGLLELRPPVPLPLLLPGRLGLVRGEGLERHDLRPHPDLRQGIIERDIIDTRPWSTKPGSWPLAWHRMPGVATAQSMTPPGKTSPLRVLQLVHSSFSPLAAREPGGRTR